ncbi:9201_t:CDS:2 [Entrophospora sp. SA101]|nr:9201_t:CDS:2 [Entrophospora sp. SA101]CAJ0845423.1 334_t:CDS:2 [Entrophospora sp. SA101]CAJ0925598.1 13939_t:CDS:2 [Entrophospora sp. SA101]
MLFKSIRTLQFCSKKSINSLINYNHNQQHSIAYYISKTHIQNYYYSTLKRTPRVGVVGTSRIQQNRPIDIFKTKRQDYKNYNDDGGENLPSKAASIDVNLPSNVSNVLTDEKPASKILAKSALVVGRQIEMLNVFMGFEQANKYVILDPFGNSVGFIAEEESSFISTILRQVFRTHRRFSALILNEQAEIVLKVHRPFAWINSHIFIYEGQDNELIGEVQQQWHLWRRIYNLFVNKRQFARIDAGFWAWDFNLEDESGGLLGSVNRNFSGFAREIFTDTGQYVIRMDSVEGSVRPLSLDERAVILAAAISIDFDYFSRHSEHGGGDNELRDLAHEDLA